MIKKKDIIKDTFVDGVLKELREFKKHRKTREEKNAMQESLIKTLKKQGYESFLGTEIEFPRAILEDHIFLMSRTPGTDLFLS